MEVDPTNKSPRILKRIIELLMGDPSQRQAVVTPLDGSKNTRRLRLPRFPEKVQEHIYGYRGEDY